MESSNLELKNINSGFFFSNFTCLRLLFPYPQNEDVRMLPSWGCYVFIGAVKPLIRCLVCSEGGKMLDVIITIVLVVVK